MKEIKKRIIELCEVNNTNQLSILTSRKEVLLMTTFVTLAVIYFMIALLLNKQKLAFIIVVLTLALLY